MSAPTVGNDWNEENKGIIPKRTEHKANISKIDNKM